MSHHLQVWTLLHFLTWITETRSLGARILNMCKKMWTTIFFSQNNYSFYGPLKPVSNLSQCDVYMFDSSDCTLCVSKQTTGIQKYNLSFGLQRLIPNYSHDWCLFLFIRTFDSKIVYTSLVFVVYLFLKYSYSSMLRISYNFCISWFYN